jgi:hypothetical protein
MNQGDFLDDPLDGYLAGYLAGRNYHAGYEAALRDAGIPVPPAERNRRQNWDGRPGGNRQNNNGRKPFWKTKYKFLLIPRTDLNRAWKIFVKVLKYCNQAALESSRRFEATTDQYFGDTLKWGSEL